MDNRDPSTILFKRNKRENLRMDPFFTIFVV